MASQAARHAAYAELVAGLLDVRDEGADERFDSRLNELLAEGLIDDAAARSLRMLQRRSVRAVIEHAQHVLPATLLAIEESHQEQQSADGEPDVGDESVHGEHEGEPSVLAIDLTQVHIGEHRTSPYDEDEDDEPIVPPTDFTARRLLVAGLTLLPDP